MSSMPELTTPVVLIIFNRPQITERVFDAVRRVRPRTLFVIADGPRPAVPGEEELCRQTRSIVERVDWPCDVRTDFSEVNLGCGRRIGGGLTRVFSQVEEAIILEDDCIPAPSFFAYCQTLLDRYRDDTRIVHISGDNFQNGIQRTRYSYFFSRYAHIWGWATWRRAWRHFDPSLSNWPEIKAGGHLDLLFEDEVERTRWTRRFDFLHDEQPNQWGYAWMYACFLNGLCVYPGVNLVSNEGFGTDATHCRRSTPHAALPTEDIWEISHPPCVLRHREADRYTFTNVFNQAAARKAAAARRGIRGLVTRAMRHLVTPLARRSPRVPTTP